MVSTEFDRKEGDTVTAQGQRQERDGRQAEERKRGEGELTSRERTA